jgi:hypothetical protein
MHRERALKAELMLVGLIFSAGVFPVAESLLHKEVFATFICRAEQFCSLFLQFVAREDLRNVCHWGRLGIVAVRGGAD